ncbi:MAG TPA: hypothetical protein VKB54_00445 [Solirubrobacteraceae bacterium]|nr:hypothetical protein [Solirubrobacteraceae bacterium]
MPPRLDTGFPTSDAQDDFVRVRRRQVMSRLARRVGREPGDVDVILPYDEVVAALGYLEESYIGLQTVPLHAILGTVDRAKGFDRQFRPTTARVRARWERIANAVRRGEPMPPISLFKIGEVYFVRDGHHRVSVARALGRTEIDAYVVEVRTRVGADRTLRMDDLPKKSHERVFHERVPLPSRARGRIAVTDAWDYGVLAEAVEAWGFRLMQDRAEFLDRPTAARLWFDEEYVPVVEMLKEAHMVGDGTETDAYLRVSRERYLLMRTHEWNEDILERVRADERKR